MAKTKVKPPEPGAYRRTRPNVQVRSEKRLTLTPWETTAITGIGISRTYQLLRSGEMPALHIAKRFYIPHAALLKWLETAGGKIA
jgi:hypothetical protein